MATHDLDSLLVAPGDSAALGAALKSALYDPALATRLVAAGSLRADHFSMMALACRYAEIYRQVARPRGPSEQISPWMLAPRLRRRNRMMA